MSKLRTLKPVAAAIVASAMSVAVAHAAENPFKSADLSTGFKVAEADKAAPDDKKAEGKCGDKKAEGKCGDKKAEGKCGDKKAEGKCGDKKKEGKCGEGKCGANKKDK